MARARLLKPGFFKNELLAELPFEGRLLFAGLWTLADRDGRLEDRPKRIKAELFPFDEVDVPALLTALSSKGFIARYTVSDAQLIQVVKFADHQTPHHREAASTLPRAQGQPRARLGKSGSSPAVTGNGSYSVTGNGSISAEPSSTPPWCVFPVVGKGEKAWGLPVASVTGWKSDYPALDVEEEIRKARAWCEANAGRRKTAKGMPAFLVNWLNRAVDRGRPSQAPAPVNRWQPAQRQGGWTFHCDHQPHCRTEGQCVQKDRGAA